MEINRKIIDYIICELKAYKRNNAIYQSIVNDCVGLSACVISDIPRTVTNKFSSTTENNALYNKDAVSLEREIKRIDIWLNCLDDEERFVVENIYINNRSYNTVIGRWHKEHNIIYSERRWKNKRRSAIKKIYEILVAIKV